MQKLAPFQALLVEGTSGVGKSTLIDGLLRHHMRATQPPKIRTLVHLAQTHTYGPLAPSEDANTLTVVENQQHLQRIVDLLEWLHDCAQEHQQPYCFVLIDTLHLTHCVRPGVVRWRDVMECDQRLAAMGCKLLTLRVTPEVLWQRGILPRMNTQFLTEYAHKFGQTNEEIYRHFIREQETLTDLHGESVMPKQILQHDEPLPEQLESVYRLWTQSTRSG